MNADQDNFPVSRFRQALHFFFYTLQAPGTNRSPCVGNDAVGAILIAAFLNFQVGPGLVRFIAP